MHCAELRQHRRTEKQCTEEQQQEEQLMQGQLQSSTKLLGAGITTVCQELEASEVCHPKSQKLVHKFDSNSRNNDRVQTCLDLINHDQLINYDQLPAERVSVLEPVSVDSCSETESETTSESTGASEATTIIDVDQILNLNYDLQIDAVPDAVKEDIQQFDGMKFVLFFYRFKFIFCEKHFCDVFVIVYVSTENVLNQLIEKFKRYIYSLYTY